MKTLRELAERGEKNSGFWGTRAYRERAEARERAVLGPYGDWRVVEGRWELGEFGGRVCVRVEHDNGILALGYEGDHIKLIIPPEEDAALGNHPARLVKYERARADRYKKALREIARPAVLDRNVYEAYHRRVRLVLEALDEED